MLKKRSKRWRGNMFQIVLLIVVITYIFWCTLHMDRAQRIAGGIFWLISGGIFSLLGFIKPLMFWVYEKQIEWVKKNQTFDEFRKGVKLTIYAGIIFAVISFGLAFIL